MKCIRTRGLYSMKMLQMLYDCRTLKKEQVSVSTNYLFEVSLPGCKTLSPFLGKGREPC